MGKIFSFLWNKYETVMSGSSFAMHTVQIIEPMKSIKNVTP